MPAKPVYTRILKVVDKYGTFANLFEIAEGVHKGARGSYEDLYELAKPLSVDTSYVSILDTHEVVYYIGFAHYM